MVCSQVCVELIPLSSKTKGSRLDGGSPRSEGNVFIDDSVGGGTCKVIQQRQGLQGGPPRLLGRRPMGWHPFEHQDPFEIYITFLPYGLLWSGEGVDTKWPMGTTGSGTGHAQKELSAAEDARKIRRPSILFFQTSQEGQTAAPAWEIARVFSVCYQWHSSHMSHGWIVLPVKHISDPTKH